MTIQTSADLARALRAGPYAWPGGYPLLFVMTDGECLCPKCARDNRALLRVALRDNDRRSGWHPAGLAIHWEGLPEICAHCGTEIPSAYGDPDAPDPA